MYLEPLKPMMRGCEPSLAEGVRYYQRCAFLGNGNRVWE